MREESALHGCARGWREQEGRGGGGARDDGLDRRFFFDARARACVTQAGEMRATSANYSSRRICVWCFNAPQHPKSSIPPIIDGAALQQQRDDCGVSLSPRNAQRPFIGSVDVSASIQEESDRLQLATK